MILGIVGFIGEGKGATGDYLQTKGFKKESFASSLKDATAAIFNWPRHLLEGDTKQSRDWREQKDTWWSNRLGKDITPRYVLQQLGTEVFRQGFHQDIWVHSLIARLSEGDYVITDVRFQNEIKAIQDAGGKIIRVQRGDNPPWYEYACLFNSKNKKEQQRGASGLDVWRLNYGAIHASEYSWCGCKIDHTLYNNGTLEDLYKQIDLVLDKPK